MEQQQYFQYLLNNQSKWAEEYRHQQEDKRIKRVIRMRQYKSRGNKSQEYIQEQLKLLNK
jgi:hypothetical protein